MGLLVKSTDSKKIHIQGTSIELPSVYARFEYANRQDGKSIEIALYSYSSRESYENSVEPVGEFETPINANVPTDIERMSFTRKVNEPINSVLIHNIIKEELEIDGYDIEIDDDI
jgi:hypothetical protein